MSPAPSISPHEVKAIRDATAENLADVLDHPDGGADVAWLERAALTLLPAFDDPEMPDEARCALPEALERRGDPPAAGMLAALEAYGGGALAGMAGLALGRLAGRGIEQPGGAGQLLLRDAHGTRMGKGELIVATLSRPGEDSVQAALVELEHWDCGPVVLGGMLTPPASEREAAELLEGPVGELAALDRDELAATLTDMLEFFPRRVSADDDLIAKTPACVVAFIEFLAAEGLLAGDRAEPLREFCAELEPEFEAACRDRANGGPASPAIEPPAAARRSPPARKAKRKATKAARKRKRG